MNKAGNKIQAGLAIGVTVLLLGGCAATTTVTQTSASQPAKSEAKQEAVPPKSEKSPEKIVEEPFLAGKVVETMRATGYTYIQLEKDGKKAWFAVPSIEVSVGQEIEVMPGTQMGQFSSKTLQKSFESIVFSPGLVADPNAPLPVAAPPAETPPAAAEQNAVPPGHPPMDGSVPTNGGTATREQLRKAGVLGVSGKVLETMNSGGYTYVLISSGDKNIWGAVPTTEVSVGQEIELLPGQTMTNFSSKSLNKTFDSVIFSTGVVPATK
jgi:hypothetical protein